MVGELILVSYYVVVLETVKLFFEFPDLRAVCVHLLTGIGPIFIDLVDDQCGVSIYHEVFDAELDGYTESVETCFIQRGVVGGWKMVGVMNKMPAPAPLMLRAPSKYITQCLGQVVGMGSWISVHSATKSASAYDLMVSLLLNSME